MLLKREIPDVVLFEHVTLPEDPERLNFVILKGPYLGKSVHASSEYNGNVSFINELDCLDNVFMSLPLGDLMELEFFQERLNFAVPVLTGCVT